MSGTGVPDVPDELRQHLTSTFAAQQAFSYNRDRWKHWLGHLEGLGEALEKMPAALDRPAVTSIVKAESAQFQSIRYGETLAESDVVASVGSRGDSYDNAMTEALDSVYKAELIDRRQWTGLVEVMAETSKWVVWYNQERLHSGNEYRPPLEVHAEWIDQGTTASVAA
jgi:transposase InsO family protein